METNYNVTNDVALEQAGQKLLDAAAAYWKEYQRALGHNAVVWLLGTGGELVIFTRGDYRHTLMENIDSIRQETRFESEARLRRPDNRLPGGGYQPQETGLSRGSPVLPRGGSRAS